MLDLPADVAERPDAKQLDEVRGEVRLDAVSFRYDADGPWVAARLYGANLRFAAPEATDTELDSAVRAARVERGWHDELLARGGRYARLAGELIT